MNSSSNFFHFVLILDKYSYRFFLISFIFCSVYLYSDFIRFLLFFSHTYLLSSLYLVFFYSFLYFAFILPKRSFVSHLKTDLIPPARRFSWSLVFRRHYMLDADQLDEIIVNSTSEDRIVPFSAWRYEGFMICIDAESISCFFHWSVLANEARYCDISSQELRE